MSWLICRPSPLCAFRRYHEFSRRAYLAQMLINCLKLKFLSFWQKFDICFEILYVLCSCRGFLPSQLSAFLYFTQLIGTRFSQQLIWTVFSSKIFKTEKECFKMNFITCSLKFDCADQKIYRNIQIMMELWNICGLDYLRFLSCKKNTKVMEKIRKSSILFGIIFEPKWKKILSHLY